MKEGTSTISEVDLHAYVDLQLDPQRRKEVEQHLNTDADLARRVQAYQRINRGLHKLYLDALSESIPEHLLNVGKAKRKSRIPHLAAAMLVAFAIGISSGWLLRDQLISQPYPAAVLVDNAFAAHAVYTPEVRHPVEVGAAEEAHLVKWLSKRLNGDIRAPQLNILGYELLGGRLLAAQGMPAAQFMYQNPQGNRLTLYVRHKLDANQDTAFQYASQDGIQGFYWIDGDFGYALIGDIERLLLAKAARIVYEELNR